MRTVFHKIVVAAFCSISIAVQAQTDSTNKVKFKFGTFYNSHLNYYGRTDSLRSSGFFPIAELWVKNRFYINAAPVFTSNPVAGFEYAGTVATAGYLYSNTKSSVHLYFVKPIYKDNSQLVQSALKAQLAGSYTWLNKILNVTAGADVKFSGNTDYGATLGIDHIFRKRISGNSILVIDPSVNVYAGTQRFTQTRYEKNGFLIFPGVEQAITEDVKKISILSYEFSMPVIYSKGKWMLLLTPAYVIPQNLVTVPNRPDISEKGQRLFYVTVGAKVTL